MMIEAASISTIELAASGTRLLWSPALQREMLATVEVVMATMICPRRSHGVCSRGQQGEGEEEATRWFHTSRLRPW